MTARRLLLIDDHTLVREALSLVLVGLSGAWDVIGVNGVEAAEAIVADEPVDLVLLDYHLPEVSGHEAFARMRASVGDGVPIVILTGEMDGARIRSLIEAGARGYILKNASADVTLSALELVLNGGTYIPGEALAIPSLPAPKLTPKQSQVLRRLVDGASNKEIAASLDASESTVRTHLSAIFRTLGVKNRAQAVRVALEQELV